MRLWGVGLLHLAVALSLESVACRCPDGGQRRAGFPILGVPRTRDGKPDLSGIWQALNTANDNLLSHSASKGVPAGLEW